VSLIVLPVGLLIGLSLGALGGGGSILTVPALVYLVGEQPAQATTSSLLIVGTTSLIALIPHARRGNVRFGQGATFGVLGIAGSFAGSLASARVPAEVLLTAFAALMLVVAVVMLRRSSRPSSPESTTMPPPALVRLRPFRVDVARSAQVVLAATVVGLLTGFFGVGGGFALVPALVLALSYPMRVAVGTSLLVIAINSATAVATRVADVHVDWATVGAFTAAAVLGSLIGGRVAAQVRPQVLTRAFAVLLVGVAAYMAVRSLPELLA
jgi:uncharacterized membrane protein YfcA